MTPAAGIAGPFAFATDEDLRTLRAALAGTQRLVVVLTGAGQAPAPRLPFDWETRARLLAQALTDDERPRVRFLPLDECWDDDALRQRAQALVGGPILHFDAARGERDALQAQVYEAGDLDALALPPTTRAHLAAWRATDDFARIAADWRQIASEKKAWSVAPYPVVLVTVDVVIQASGHVLLIRRGRSPGKGLRALPGGFLDPGESIYDAALRELVEETEFGLPLPAMRAALRGVRVFDHPQRSQRGRVVTHAHHFDLGAPPLPPVTGADDAAAAEWVPVARLPSMQAEFLDDHFHILRHFGVSVAGATTRR